MQPSFSKYANQYRFYKIIQEKVAAYLIENCLLKEKRILDLGAGCGNIYKNINWEVEKFLAVDNSKEMLLFHPKKKGVVKKIVGDFNKKECFEKLKKEKIDFIFASSSLQWSKDLNFTLHNIKQLSTKIAFAIFTDKTFEEIYKTTSLQTPLLPVEKIIYLLNRYFVINYEIKTYKLFFTNTISMLKYMKRSGVIDSKRRLGYKETKKLIEEYDKNYLKFEVIFAWSK
jgi:malonyl-CoA O-methyltransferase